MDLREYIKNFNYNEPDWSDLPEGFPDCNLSGLESREVGRFLGILTHFEMSHPQKSKARSRVWQNPTGYRFLIPWTNAVLLRLLVRKFTGTLPLFSRGTLKEFRGVQGNIGDSVNSFISPLKSFNASEHRLVAQLNDCARSVVSNIEEGFKRPTTGEYLTFLGYSEASLEEVKGDINRSLQDRLIRSRPGSGLLSLGIELRGWYEWCRNPKNDVNLLGFPLKLKDNKGLYRSLEEIKGEELSYEIFMEIINKTGKLLIGLVESLERKMAEEQKFYLVEQARIRDNIKGRR